MGKPKQVIVVRKDLGMSSGKLAAQVAHGSMKTLIDRVIYRTENSMTIGGLNQAMNDWLTEKFTKIVVSVNSERELLDVYQAAIAAGLPHGLILDEGLTEFGGIPTYTVCAIGPEDSDKIDPITRKLPLMR